MNFKEKYNKEIIPEMKKKFGYKNNLAVPKITKVVVGIGTGSVKDNAKKDLIQKSLALIAGQKLRENPAKKSIATFKLREGSIIGYSTTLRGKRMHDFIQKFINVALPRVRDFRGLDSESVDEIGNFSVGIKEHTVFPETGDEDIRSAFGFGVTVVTTAKTKEEALELLKLTGFPFKK